jgi:IS5 family transposase
MRPKNHRTTGESDLFRSRLDQIINMKHEPVQLVGKIDWDWIDGEIALQRERSARDRDPLHDRAAAAPAHLRGVR